MEWNDLINEAQKALEEKGLDGKYRDRLEIESDEITKQGANEYWLENYKNKETWPENPSGLVIPWLLGMTQVDPIAANIQHKWEYQTDYPDIDLDFCPPARGFVKQFALEKYIHVCSVGSWVTYKPKSALQDVSRALGIDLKPIIAITTNLPDEFDDLDLDDLKKYQTDAVSKDEKVAKEAKKELAKYLTFYELWAANPDLVDKAFRLVGKIRAQGTHAGGLIIADRPIENIVPLSYLGSGDEKNWTSQWTEGKSTQLSKFGLVKYDILGVKTIFYIWYACKLIEQTRGIKIDCWSDMDPTADPPYAGFEINPDGSRNNILLNDPDAIKMCNELRTDSVFQIETPIQKRIIKDGRVRDFWDLVVYNALGRPGPMDMIPEYIKRRDDPNQEWKKEDKRILDILGYTYGVIVYQEQLQAMWVRMAKFTAPEAEAARKIIAKKWQDKLPQVEEKWKRGATKTLAEDVVKAWWEKMIDFGRYAFNKSHSVAYSLITYHCLYLKAHYPAEWWAAVMTECHADKLGGYLNAARIDGVQFGTVDINSLSREFGVRDNRVVPGLHLIKGIGDKAADLLCAHKGPFKNVDELVEKVGKNKIAFERLIKLGAFNSIHANRHGLWKWYMYKYVGGVDIRREIIDRFNPPEQVEQLKREHIERYQRIYPNKKVPKTVLNFKPKLKVPEREEVIAAYEEFTPAQVLKTEKDFLGFYWSNPLDLYEHDGNGIIAAKETGVLECVVQKLETKRSKNGNTFYVLKVTDGIQTTDIILWADTVRSANVSLFEELAGVRIHVDYNPDRNSFKIASGTSVTPLFLKGSDKQHIVQDEEVLVTEDPLW